MSYRGKGGGSRGRGGRGAPSPLQRKGSDRGGGGANQADRSRSRERDGPTQPTTERTADEIQSVMRKSGRGIDLRPAWMTQAEAQGGRSGAGGGGGGGGSQPSTERTADEIQSVMRKSGRGIDLRPAWMTNASSTTTSSKPTAVAVYKLLTDAEISDLLHAAKTSVPTLVSYSASAAALTSTSSDDMDLATSSASSTCTTLSQDPALLMQPSLAGEDLYETIVRQRHYKEASLEQQAAIKQQNMHNSAKKNKKEKEKEKEKGKKALAFAAAAEGGNSASKTASVKMEVAAVLLAPIHQVKLDDDDDLYGDLGDMGGMGGDDDLYGDLGGAVGGDGGSDAEEEPMEAEAGIDNSKGEDDFDSANTDKDNNHSNNSSKQGNAMDQQDLTTHDSKAAMIIASSSGAIQTTQTGIVADEVTGAYPLDQSVSTHFGQNTSTSRMRMINGGRHQYTFATLLLATQTEARAILSSS